MFSQNFVETELFSRNLWIFYNFIFQQRRWTIETFLVNCNMLCARQNTAFVEVQYWGYYCTKIKKAVLLETYSPSSSGISLHPGTPSTFQGNFTLFSAQGQKCFATSHYSFYPRFVITHYTENINNKKMLIAAVCTDTGQLS